MQPVNKSERTKAFVNFLLLFLLSLAIILSTVFFSVQVPFKQNKELRSQNNIVQRDRVFTADFLNGMSGIVRMLDTINTSPKPDLLDGEISESLKRLNAKVNADSAYDKNLYLNVVQNMYDLQIAKKQLRELTAKDYSANDLYKQIEDYRARLELCENTKNSLIQQINIMNQRK